MNKTCITYTVDCLRGPSLLVGSGCRLADGRLESKNNANWAKVKRVVSACIKASEPGNVISLNILIQPNSVRRVNSEKEET